ncbi:hypothetical protein ACLMJK_006386 [Lecanora helva]
MAADISHSGLLALMWTGSGVATGLTLGRAIIRFRTIGRFFWDDAFQMVSWALMLGENLSFTLYLPTVYKLSAIEAGEVNLSMELVSALQLTDLKYGLALRLVFWSCLWAAKGSFLALYWHLFKPSKAFVKAWWMVLVFTVVTYFVCIAGVLTACGSTSDILNIAKCNTYHWDLAIMSLALWKTWGLQMRLSQKMSLSVIYCLVVILMVFDVIRIEESLVENSWALSSFFDIFEVVLVVIIAAIPGYRPAFTGHWLDTMLARMWSLTSSSKRSLVSRLGKRSSKEAIEEQTPRCSENTFNDRCPLNDQGKLIEQANLAFHSKDEESQRGDESFRAIVEGI